MTNTCGLCGADLTGKSDEGRLILENVAAGRVDKELCSSCYMRLKSNWGEFQVQIMHSET